MIDYIGFIEYLRKIGFAENGINTYRSYISENKLQILENINDYKNLSDEDKLIKFSNETIQFRDIFNQFHNYANASTFNDLRSGARRYKNYLQYKALIKTIDDYSKEYESFDLNGAYIFFKIFDDKNLYPVKAICRKNLEILELSSDFRTIEGKQKLESIFNQQNKINIEFIDKSQEGRTVKKEMNIKNIILYGAPGVGKTHNYKKLISLIEQGKSPSDIFDSIQKNEKFIDEDKSFKNVKNEKRVEFVTFHQSFSYEDFIEGFRPQESGNIEIEKGVFREISKNAEEDDKNFYLVIDEINRGNISKIFGELITLIEESKRDNYEVTLPYSKQKFSVPSNLFIIGTMNTTDKSIALIDVALRRRFTFIKMKPNSDLVLDNFKSKFEALNKLITEHIGEDYQIGHSYFMNIEESDLDFVLKYKIKPLLEEYYYGDEERLKSALEIIGIEENK